MRRRNDLYGMTGHWGLPWCFASWRSSLPSRCWRRLLPEVVYCRRGWPCFGTWAPAIATCSKRILGGIASVFLRWCVNETNRTRSLWPGKKNSFFLVFRKLTYSPNSWRRFVVELSKVKEPSTTDSFLFVSKCNVRQCFLFFWRSFVS